MCIGKDDSSIPDDAILLRRVPPSSVKSRQNDLIPNSDVFNDPEMSTHLVESAENIESSTEMVLRGHAEFFLVKFTAGLVRGLGLSVVRAPIDADPNHVLVTGKTTRGDRRRLARECEWVKPPAGWYGRKN